MAKYKVTIDCGGLLFVLFLCLLIAKLTGLVTWSWWIICLPLYLPVAIFLGIAAIGVILTFLYVISSAIIK